MREIGSTKIGRLAPKPNIVYPIVRLPQAHGDVIGSHVTIFETSYDEKKAFLLVLDNAAKQPSVLRDCERCNLKEFEKLLNALEKRIQTIEDVTNANRGAEPATPSGVAGSVNGLEEIRTPDLRHVKATS